LHHGALSRRRITLLTGLASSTISDVVNHFIEEGLLIETGINGRPSGRRGAPEVLVDLAPRGAAVFAIGLGTYSLRVALVGTRGQNIRRAMLHNYSSPHDPEKAMEWIVTTAGKLLQESGLSPDKVIGTGVQSQGLVLPDSGAAEFDTFSIWHGFPILQVLQERLGVPAILTSAAYNLALKEVWFGYGRRVERLVCVFQGSGVECAVVNRHRGVYTYSVGDIGHVLVDKAGNMCRCGQRGCLETIATDPAVESAGIELARRGQSTRLLEMADNHQPEHITASIVAQASQEGDRVAAGILAASAAALGSVLAPILALHSPQAVVLSGNQLRLGGESFLAPLRNSLRALAFTSAKELPPIVNETLDPDCPDLTPAVAALDRFLYAPQLDARGE
ncbi:MAG: ROK family protein, partial [Chloroflexi bacterium]|nr:ROK family protein [Chloroflexota bacterium]